MIRLYRPGANNGKKMFKNEKNEQNDEYWLGISSENSNRTVFRSTFVFFFIAALLSGFTTTTTTEKNPQIIFFFF